MDECTLLLAAGNGGDGCIAFRREAFVPFGGPSGGDGGNGGSVIFEGDEGKNSLLDLNHLKHITAERGEHGKGKDKYGRAGKDEIIRVPVGTIVRRLDDKRVLGELLSHGQQLVAAQGGLGGRGNKHFPTPIDRAPRKAEPGVAGETLKVSLELKVMADVGLLGFPNVGKSTFIATVSRARPKIADYPFTTLVPQLGVVKLDDWVGADPGDTMVVADIPGLVPGASDGAGLGTRFLRHVQRTRVLLHLVTLQDEPDRDPLTDYATLRGELAAFDQQLASRPEVVVISKSDQYSQEQLTETLERFQAEGHQVLTMSAATRKGVAEVVAALRRASQQALD